MTSNSLRSWRYGERKIKFWEPPETSGEAARNTLSPSPHSPRGFAAFFISRMLTIPPATQARRRINTTNYKVSIGGDVHGRATERLCSV